MLPDDTIKLLYSNHSNALRVLIRRKLGDIPDLEDIVQEAFLRVHRAQKTTEIKDPRNFLFRTTLNLVTDRLRHKQRVQGRLKPLDDDPAIAAHESLISHLTPEQHVEDRQRLDEVMQVVDAMPPQARRVFLLHRVLRLTHKEIAELLGIAPSTVEKHVIRALRDLRHAFTKEDE